MKYLLALSIFFSVATGGATEPDKKKHYWASGAIASATYVTFRRAGHGKLPSYLGGVAAALTIGTFKELIDPKFDWRDMEYNALGAVTVPLLFTTF